MTVAVLFPTVSFHYKAETLVGEEERTECIAVKNKRWGVGDACVYGFVVPGFLLEGDEMRSFNTVYLLLSPFFCTRK